MCDNTATIYACGHKVCTCPNTSDHTAYSQEPTDCPGCLKRNTGLAEQLSRLKWEERNMEVLEWLRLCKEARTWGFDMEAGETLTLLSRPVKVPLERVSSWLQRR